MSKSASVAERVAIGEVGQTDDEFLCETADRIRMRMSRTGKDIVEIGRELIEVKERIGHGKFLPWIDREFGMSEWTARNFMRVADRFKSGIIPDLPATVLYALADRDTPEEVCTEITERAAAGEIVTVDDVRTAKGVVGRGRRNGRSTEVDLAEVRRAADRRTVTTGLMEMLDLFERDGVDPTDRAKFIIDHFDRDMAGKIGQFSIARFNRALKAMIPVLQAIHR
jgi:hypothetical protein